MLVGYARVSKDDQDLSLQIDALNEIKCERIFEDTASGTKSNRPGLENALSHLREGDTLVVWKLDRLGRTVKGLVDLIIKLEHKKVQFRSITDGIDTNTIAGRFFFHIMASLAQMERDLVAERTKAGLEAARKLGRLGGRKRKMSQGKIEAAKELFKKQIPPKEIADTLNISVPTLYRWLPAATR